MVAQLVIQGLVTGAMYVVIALGFALIYQTVRFFHFAHGAVYTVGAYVGYSMCVQCGMPPVGGFIFATGLAGLLGLVIDRLVYRPLRRRKASNLVYLIASFGVFLFLQNFVQLVYGAQIRKLRTGPAIAGHHVFNTVVTDTQLLIVGVGVALVVAVWAFMQRTRLGKATRAVADDSVAASVVGIRPDRIIAIAFFVGSALAGAAGFLVSLETNLEPTMGMQATLKGMISSIVGGVGSIPGAVIGGLFLGLVENLGIWKIAAGWKDCIAFVTLIVFLLLRPGGFLGVRSGRMGM